MFPGITTNGLELWRSSFTADSENTECGDFMERNMGRKLWGSAHGITELLRSPKCWLYHLMLNETTGLDPDHSTVRPLDGPKGANYLFAGYVASVSVLTDGAMVYRDAVMISLAS